MRLRKLPAALLAAGTAAALAAVAPAAASAAPGPRAQLSPVSTASTSITLITGDRVIVAPDGRTSVESAPGRAGTRFVSRKAAGHHYVIPADALPLVQRGRLDQRLFDLTALRNFGYTGEAELPLLVAYPRSGNRKGPAAARAATGATARIARDLGGVGALAVRAQRTARAELWTSLTGGTAAARTLSPGVERIYLDGKRKLNLDVSVPQIGAPAAWQAGLDGTGVTVAVLDSGIDATHPDFAGKIVAAENFTPDPNADDLVGHGTHVASIIAGSGAKSGGKYKGVAPGAKLAIGKVCSTEFCEESSILAGMQWAAKAAPVINISLGGGDTANIDPLEQAVDDLTAAHGALFVISAGNSGATATIGSPGSADSALTVGAVDDEDQLADFSSRGPRVGDDAIKPDITGPGVDIVAARAANGQIGTPAGDGYVSLSGTSMSSPHVAGAAAIVTQQHPGWSPNHRKTLLMGAAKPAPGVDVFGQGAGRVDVARVVRQAVSVDEGSISFGRQQWPHDDDVPVTETVTYRNGGTAPITLALALTDASDTFSVAATSLTVPAGGTATTTVTADTSGEGTDGFKSARLVATGPGDVRVETPVAVNREVESYDVKLVHVGRDGKPAEHVTSFNRLDELAFHDVFSAEPTDTIRLPKGEYGLFTWIYGAEDMTMLVQPKVVIDGPLTIRLDARRGEPVKITVPRKDATPVLVAANADWVNDEFGVSVSALSETGDDMFLGQVGPRRKQPGFYGSINAAFAKYDAATESFRDTPFTYSLAYLKEGAFYTGFAKRVRAGELATVRSRFAREAEGATGIKLNWPNLGPNIGGWAAGLPFSLPSQRTEWLSTEGATTWAREFDQEVQTDPDSFPELLSIAFSDENRYRAGRTYSEDWNRAVFAPWVGGDINAALRIENTIVAGVPLFGDGVGHWGDARPDTARTALYSGGKLIGEEPSGYAEFEVPAGNAQYRLEQSATRGAPFRLSTSVSAAWTFRSATAGETPTRLPLSTVRFSPRVNELNVAPAGKAFSIPVTVGRTSGSAARPNRTLTAEFSTDDGRTWQPATVRGTGDRRTVQVTNPAGPGFVSLRANATDAAGNTAAVTVLRAYEVR
ncbi:S8 family serine peptidase [Actinoplanes auranticolor]|uniref:Serine protease n=1 Tax=Actinoplanes auranticolor TaxID=47988 RepID=A0A919VI95_9ACTN|nr:S8 family serine peptidase [Actinoplanes auranticolor]GIM66759.1 serine protease [Actinoplanes auranticolor]